MDSTERAHAILSPSFLKIALACPASVGLKESLPPEPAGAAAIKGTAIHEAAALMLQAFLEHKNTGEDKPVFKEAPEPEVLKVAAQWRDIIWEKAFEKSITGKTYAIEDRLVYSEKYSLWGTADFWMVSYDERAKLYGMVCDLKSGFLHVDAEQNPQLAAYACALREEVRKNTAGKRDLDYVRVAIYQPFGDGDKYRESKFTGKQLDRWEAKFKKLAQEVYSKNAKFKAGEHCSFCPGRVRCPTYDTYRTKETGLQLLDPTEIKFPELAAIPDETLVRIVRHEKQLDSFVKACRKELTMKLLRGEKVAGMKLVEAKTRRKWDESRVQELGNLLAQKQIGFYENVPRSITEIREELSKDLEKKEVEALLKPFLIQPPGGIVMADSRDARDEVKPTHGLFIEE